MFCKNCGNNLENNQSICPNCFTEVSSSISNLNLTEGSNQQFNNATLNMEKPMEVRKEIPNNSVMYIVFSAIETVMCCQPLGIISLVFSILAYDAFKYGDEERGKKHLKLCKILLIIGISLFAIFIILYIALIVFSVMSEVGTPLDYNSYNL